MNPRGVPLWILLRVMKVGLEEAVFFRVFRDVIDLERGKIPNFGIEHSIP